MATLPLAWALTRRALPDRDDTPFHPDFMALIAPFGLAMSVRFTVWNSSGLENLLFCFLLTLGLYRCVVELEDEASRTPRSCSSCCVPLVRKASCMRSSRSDFGRGTRCSRLRDVRVRWDSGCGWWDRGSWCCSFPWWLTMPGGTGTSPGSSPTPTTQSWEPAGPSPFSWTRKGWKYINAWAGPHGGLLAACGCVGLMGLGRRMRWAVVGLLAVYGVLLGWDGKEGLDVTPAWWSRVSGAWVKTRVLALAALVPLFWFASLRSRAWRAQGRHVALCSRRTVLCRLRRRRLDEGAPVVQPLQRGLGRDGGRQRPRWCG